MAAEAAALLDELMGRNRNFDPKQDRPELHWSDDDVCKYYLCGFCPNELFINTRADLGACSKLHDDALKKEYEKSSRFQKMSYEEEFIRFLSSLISDVERRIRRGHQRLTINQAQNNALTGGGKEEKGQMLTQRINELVEQAENLGCEGKVEEAQGVMKLCEQLKEERTELENYSYESGPAGLVKQMEVCEICGALLIVGDAEQRVQEHLLGKQHMGYAQVRATVKEWEDKKRNSEMEREEKLRKEREEREKEREKERQERRKEREKEEKKRRRTRSRSRGRRSRSRDRRRSRSKDRRRTHSRERKRSRRSRSRERSRRSRSKDRSRRSRSRDRKSSRHRSKSRDHERSHRSSHDSRSRNEDKRKSKEEHDKKPKEDNSDKDDVDDKITENCNGDIEGNSSTNKDKSDSRQEEGAGDASTDPTEGDSN